jgi:predicted lipid-binding transport protein (Tim44 family)
MATQSHHEYNGHYVRPDTRVRARRASSAAMGWIGGAILIMVGGIFLTRNFGLGIDGNWWAFFILIPALTTGGTAMALFRANDNRLNRASAGAFASSVSLVVLAAIFLLELDWSRVWPVFMILAGLSTLLQWTVRHPADRE